MNLHWNSTSFFNCQCHFTIAPHSSSKKEQEDEDWTPSKKATPNIIIELRIWRDQDIFLRPLVRADSVAHNMVPVDLPPSVKQHVAEHSPRHAMRK
jgi:hypothetical protein